MLDTVGIIIGLLLILCLLDLFVDCRESLKIAGRPTGAFEEFDF